MSKPKLPHEFTLEELLASIHSPNLKEEVSTEYDSPVLSFLQTFSIKSGKERISDVLLYDLYKLWNIDAVMNRRIFNIHLGKFLKAEYNGRRYYHINKNFMAISEQIQKYVNTTRRSKSASLVWQRHFNKFLSETGLKAGNLYVEGDILFYVYNTWCDSRKKKSGFSYITFLGMCKMHFDTKKITRSPIFWLGVNENIKQLIDKESVTHWRNGRRQFRTRTQYDTKKTKIYHDKIQKRYRGIALYPEKIKKSKK